MHNLRGGFYYGNLLFRYLGSKKLRTRDAIGREYPAPYGLHSFARFLWHRDNCQINESDAWVIHVTVADTPACSACHVVAGSLSEAIGAITSVEAVTDRILTQCH